MRKGILFCVVFALIAAGFGFSRSPVTLKGRVSSSDGKPLPDVKIYLENLSISTKTGADGIFVLENLEGQELNLVFTHPDYISQSLEVSPSENFGQMLQVVLVEKNPMLRTIKEEITVTAEADSIIDINLPSHRTILPSSVLTEMGTANLTESVDKVPGLAMVGKGGYSMSPAVRGLAEHRVLLLVDGVRITSERRIGANASFISLGNIDRIEINRGPYSVFHGSGAVGGIINIITKTPASYAPLKGDFQIGYNTARKERTGTATLSGSLGKWGILFGANGKKADDYSAPSGLVEWSRYSDYSLTFKLNRQDKKSRFYATIFHYQGDDIGKPSPTAHLKPRWYPNELNTLFTIGYELQNFGFLDGLNTSVFILRSVLETQADNLRDDDLSVKKRNLARIENTNFGFKLRGSKRLKSSQTLSFGLDYFGQAGMNDHNTEWLYERDGTVIGQTEETSLQDAQRNNLGAYIDDKIQVSSAFSFNLGARFDLIRTSNVDFKNNRISGSDEFFSFYLGSIFQITPQLSFLANIGRSFRFPSISELFYTGLTGRGTVFGNPDLDPETSLNLDFGLRYLHEKFFASIYGFSNTINHMIQKYGGDEAEEFYYRNLTSGRILGVEGEFYASLARDVELFINFHHLEGKEKETDTALNYIPPTRFTFWGKYSPGKFWIEPRLTLSAAVKSPGPLEIAADGYMLFDTIFGFKVNPRLTLLAIVQNILDQTYHASADVDGVDAPGRGLVVRAKYAF